MNRRLSLATVVLALVAAAAWSTACGEDERPRIERSRLGPVQPVAEKSDARIAAERRQGEDLVDELVLWPEGAGEPRDARADYRDCHDQVEQKPDVLAAHPLVRVKWIQDCMMGKGWARNPDPRIPEG